MILLVVGLVRDYAWGHAEMAVVDVQQLVGEHVRVVVPRRVVYPVVPVQMHVMWHAKVVVQEGAIHLVQVVNLFAHPLVIHHALLHVVDAHPVQVVQQNRRKG